MLPENNDINQLRKTQIMALTMENRDGKIWYNGQLVEWREAKTHVLTHSLHYGMGVFEGVRAYDTPKGTAIFRLQDHTKRLFNSAKIVGMTLPFTPQQIKPILMR